MRFDRMLLEWLIWSILSAIVIGGAPWIFPNFGKDWLSSLKSTSKVEHKGFFHEKQFQNRQFHPK